MTGRDSIFSLLKNQDSHDEASRHALSPVPLSPPTPPKQQEELFAKVAALEVKIKQLEEKAAKQSSVLVQSVDPELLHGIERRLYVLENRPAETQEKSAPATDLEEKMKLLVKNAEEGIRVLLEDYRSSGEEKSANMTELVKEYGRAAEDDRQANADSAAELSRRLKTLKSELGETLEQLSGALTRTLKESENVLKSLLAEERARREESEAEAAARLKKLEREEAAIKADMDKFHIELSIVKEGVLGAADKAYREVHDRLSALAGKLQGDVMSAAVDKFSTLQSTWEAAAVEIHNAQKTAYCALEKCRKFDTDIFLLEHKTAALEKKYSQYVADQPEPGASENNGTGSI